MRPAGLSLAMSGLISKEIFFKSFFKTGITNIIINRQVQKRFKCMPKYFGKICLQFCPFSRWNFNHTFKSLSRHYKLFFIKVNILNLIGNLLLYCNDWTMKISYKGVKYYYSIFELIKFYRIVFSFLCRSEKQRRN